MNTINFDQTGGFPLETETLKKMQTAFLSLQQLGFLAGDKAIVSGCTTSGSSTTDGYIFLNGELLFFKGGTNQTYIVIQETIETAEYEDLQLKDTYITRTACFGTGVTQYEWSDFRRIYPSTSSLFIDEIRMFAGSLADLPSGWFFCDGSNGTADLRSRFIVGLNPAESDYDTIGKVGGSKEHTLTENEMPSHNHGMEDGAGGDDGAGRVVAGSAFGIQDLSLAFTKNTGGDQPHENRPPFYTLAFIQFKGI